MKRTLGCLFALFCLTVFLEPLVVFATDGSLEIKTGISQGTDTKEIYYIEQEEDLSRLFRTDVSEHIKAYQLNLIEKEEEVVDKLFLEELVTNDSVSTYQAILFNPETQLQSKGDYAITLAQKKASFSIWVWGLLLVGSGVTAWSLYTTIKGKRGK